MKKKTTYIFSKNYINILSKCGQLYVRFECNVDDAHLIFNYTPFTRPVH